MKKLSFIVFAFCLLLASCSSDSNGPTMEEESQKLDAMYSEIIELSLMNSQPCTNPDEWEFVLLSPSNCGAFKGYIPYSKKINKTEFLAKVKTYIHDRGAYYSKWQLVADCAPTTPPIGIECTDGKPKVIFNEVFQPF
ncbi:hypothetical protein [Flavobacterium sp. N1736]|uniref:hypothetical protein n=1 Tax=Flavobacterium sp. N1736 TaxID=2986823 RepID=UPI002224B212|nr:hypothetical protein [Flavobacterium sp. N1736]